MRRCIRLWVSAEWAEAVSVLAYINILLRNHAQVMKIITITFTCYVFTPLVVHKLWYNPNLLSHSRYTDEQCRVTHAEKRICSCKFRKAIFLSFPDIISIFFLFLQLWETILWLNLYHSTGFVSNHKANTLRGVMEVISYHIMYSFHDIPHWHMHILYHSV